MGFFSIRDSVAHVAVAVLLTAPTSAAPSRLMGRDCLANIVSDLSCADSSIMTRCIAIEKVDAELLATCLEAAGCTEDEAENALWITEKCQTAPTSGQTDDEGELRRRFHARNTNNNNKRADTTSTSEESSTSTSATSTSTSSTTSTSTSATSSATSSTTATSTTSSSTTSTSTTSSASSTSTSSSSSVDIGLSSAIVGTTLGVAAVLVFGGVFIMAWREGAAKRKAKREVAQKEALMSNIG